MYPGCLSRIRIFPSRIQCKKIRIRNKEFEYFTPKKLKQSSRKYDPGWLFLIRDPIPDPGGKKAPDPGSATLGVNRFLFTLMIQRPQVDTTFLVHKHKLIRSTLKTDWYTFLHTFLFWQSCATTAKHVEGAHATCLTCGKFFKTRDSLRKHVRMEHNWNWSTLLKIQMLKNHDSWCVQYETV